MPPSRRCLLGLTIAAAGCSRSPTETTADPRTADLEFVAVPDPCPSAAGWESVSFAVQARVAGTLEIDVVDRWDPTRELKSLMGPNDVRYGLGRIDKEAVSPGAQTTVHWAFGRGTPSPQPKDTDGCRPLRDAHADLLQDYEDPTMCTRGVANLGRSGSASSMFTPSCFADRGFVPHRFERTLPASGPAGRWHWIAAWVWAPPGVELAFAETADAWSFTANGERMAAASSPLPAWTLRAKLDVDGPPPPKAERVQP